MRARVLLVATACLLGVAVANCSSPSTDSTGNGGTDAGASPDAGGGSDAGASTDAGSGSGGGGSIDAGGGSGGGGGSSDAGDASGGGSDGGGSPDAGDASGGGSGGATAECDGLAPAPPGPGIEVAASYDTNFGSCADRTTSDGTGAVLLESTNGVDFGQDEWTAFDSSGNKLGFVWAGNAVQPMPFPLESGFQWFNFSHGCSPMGVCTDTAALRQLTSSLQETSRTTLYSYSYGSSDPPPDATTWGASNDVGRGTVVTWVLHKPDPFISWGLIVQRFDASGTALSFANIAPGDDPGMVPPAQVISGVSQNGMTLVLWTDSGVASQNNSSVRGRWLDANGNRSGPIFEAAPLEDGHLIPANAHLSLSRLLDGSLVLQKDGRWWVRYEAGATSPGAAPDWLASRPNTTLSIIRQGTAYLLTFPSSCAPLHAALFSKSGTNCSEMDFPTRTCARRGTSGYDGTVIVSGIDTQASRCARTFWPRFLN